MQGDLADLTDKEKEALRLLLAGHDAKSSAAELDLSVHTVNDRLRNARRKLGVSSSREAARILGDTEGGGPQSDAHRAFGMAEREPGADDTDLDQPRHAVVSRAAWLAGGMLIMSILIAAAVLSLVQGDAEPVSGNEVAAASAVESAAESAAESVTESPGQDTAAVVAEDPASVDRAERFLARVDAGDWAGSWEVAGPYFQSEASLEEWTAMVQPVRAPLGDVLSRELVTVQRADSLPGAPEGEYEVLQYSTQFSERSLTAVETVIMLEGADGWEVVVYFIR